MRTVFGRVLIDYIHILVSAVRYTQIKKNIYKYINISRQFDVGYKLYTIRLNKQSKGNEMIRI